MTPSIGKKLSVFIGAAVLLSCFAIGYVSYILMEAKFADVLRKDTLDAATLLSSRVRNELRHIAEKGRFLSAAALEDFRNPDDQIRFLEENLTIDDQYIAMSLLRRSPASKNKWTPVFRLTRPEEDPSHLAEEDFDQLDLKYPMDYKRVGEGAIEVAVGALKDNTPILRMAVPIVEKKGVGFTQLLQIEVRQERITAAFTEATAHFSFILDRHGRAIAQTDPTHFTYGEDLSHLPILQMARATEAPNGNLDYYELPGGVLQYGSFHKVGFADLIVVTQAPRSHVIFLLRTYTRQAVLVGFTCVFLAMALGLLASWGVVGARLASVASVLRRIGDGKYAVTFPETHTSDEVGDFARTLQDVCDELKEREKVHGTFAKLKNRKIKTKIQGGKISLKGERLKAMVLQCQLHGIEPVIAQAEPELLITALNRFNQAVTEAIENRNGVVDHIHGGSIVAYWGVPLADETDADNALATALEIREFGRALNESLKKARLPQVNLAMGLHFGPVVAGQLGSSDRLEYTVLGEALEIAARIQTFTDQFGTDFLMTSQAASRAPQWYSTEKVSSGDENTPELHELVGSVARGAKPPTRKKSEKKNPTPETESPAPADADSAETTASDSESDASDTEAA